MTQYNFTISTKKRNARKYFFTHFYLNFNKKLFWYEIFILFKYSNVVVITEKILNEKLIFEFITISTAEIEKKIIILNLCN